MKNQPKRFMLLSMLAVLLGTSLPAVAQTDYAIRTSALSEHDANAPIGFGAGVTGSDNANPITVTTRDALITALSGTDAQTIYVDGTIEFSGSVNISGVKNKTVIGLPGATLSNPTHSGTKSESGIMTLTNCQNIIIRNLTFQGAGAYDIDGYDNLTLTNSQNIWIDHCDFQDGVDGNLDCNNGSDNICVSWCRFSYKTAPWSGGSGGTNDHRFSNLWGSGDNVSADVGHLNTTFVNCWWDEGCKQRMPRIRFGQVHLLNCLYNSSVADYCIGAGYRSNAYVENCYFDTSYGAAWQNYASGSYTDYNITLTGNYGAADEKSQSGSISYFTPSYDYTAYNASDVKSTLTAANGAGATLQFGEDEEELKSGTVFSANIIATLNQSFNSGTTEITAEQATIEGGKIYAISGQSGAKDLIAKQGSTYYFCMTNNNTYFKIELDHALAIGDVITADALGGEKNSLPKGLWITTTDGYPSAAPTCAGTSTEASIVENILNYTVTEGSEYVGAKTLYIYRAAGATEYFGKFKINRPASEESGEEPEPEVWTWRDFAVNLTNTSIFDTSVTNFGVKIAENGTATAVAADDATANFVCNSVRFNDTQHGWVNCTFTVKVNGPVLVKLGDCRYGTQSGTITDGNSNVTAIEANETKDCWDPNAPDQNLVSTYYTGLEPTTLTIYYEGYCPFISVTAVDPADLPSQGGEDPDPGEEETGVAATIYWPMNEPANYTNNTVTSEAQFATVNVDLGVVRLMDANGNENATGTSTVSSGVTFSQMRPTNGGSDYVTWQVKPQAGQMFKPKKVSAYIVRFGTDAEHGVTFSARVGTGEPLVLGTYTAPRNNKSQSDDKFGESDDYAVNGYVEINLTEEQQTALTSGDTFSLMGTIGVSNAKAGGIAQVTIEGTVSGSVQQFTTVYDLAAAMMTAPKNIEGFASSLAATSTEAGSNATDILVDATSGKLGKNNADWAQLNEGTILTIPGVPEGAQVTFALYNTTALTINGVAYTNGQTYTATKNENLTMTCTTGGYIKSITVVGSAFVYVPETEGYTNTWQFGKSNGAPEFALQGSPEYNYEVGDYSLIINTAAGKLNNASRTDQWAQCNNGTLFKVPMYAGSKLSWGRYNSGSDAGFVVDGKLFNEYYIASEEGTVEFKAQGISYLSFIKIEPATLYEISGTITGGNIDGSTITLTAAGNGETYSAAIAEGAFTLKVPADTYTFDLSEDAPYVVSTPENLLINADGSIGEITITAAEPQDVTGLIANAPAEAFTLTFTGASHNKQVELAANATSFATTLDPDTYVISSSVGTLSPLSVESFKVLKDAVSHNIYFPEEAVPAATQQNITVDNTAAVAANVYNTVTDALAAAKAGNISNPVITLTSGQTYQEQVIVDQAGVTLKTSGAEKATITFYYGIGYTYYSLNEKGYYDKDRAMTRNSILMKDPDRWGCTVKVTNKGNNFKAENIIFENSFNQRYTAEEVTDGVRPNGCQGITYDRTLTSEQGGFQAADAKAVTERAAALAFENNPTGCQLYDCILIGSQDTYYTSGFIYNKNCDIVGNTDYIFGGGKVVFDNCNLVIGGYSDKETSAYITAQKGSAGDHYIFRDCTVKKGDRNYTLANLGRDWGGPDATVYYFNLKNEMGNKLEYKWTNMGGGVSAGTANLHIYDFDPAINANYNTTGANGANVNGVLADDVALSLYAKVVVSMGFTPERIYEDKVELSESSAYNICRIAASDNVERDVTLTRTLAAGQWTAIVLPFSMTSEQIADAFGAGAKVAELSSTTNTALYFTTVDAMEANQPYIIQVSDDFTAVNINGVTITKADPTVVFGGWTATGTYAAGKIPAGSHYISNNMVKKAADDTNDITAMSVYFTNTFADAVELYVDGISTCIKDVKSGQSASDAVYTLQGVRVEKAQKGLYIVNGRKAIVK